ncbi:MAG: GNAT family N-acetyltransferase [Nitrospinota bacterium]
MSEARPVPPGGGEGLRPLLAEALGPGPGGAPPAHPEGSRLWAGHLPGAGAPAGFCRAVPDEETRARGRLCLDALYVSPPHRRKGLGRALLQAAREAARAEGLEGLWAYSHLELPPAFVERTGGAKLRALQFFHHGRLAAIPSPRIPQGYRVRALSLPADLAPAASLYNAAFGQMWNFRPHTAQDIARWFEEGDASAGNCLLIESLSGREEPAGLLGMAVLAVDPARLGVGDKTAYLPDIGVHPAHRGKGWGEILLASAAARALEMGLTGIELVADASDEGACGFYRRMGFEARGTLRVYEWLS